MHFGTGQAYFYDHHNTDYFDKALSILYFFFFLLLDFFCNPPPLSLQSVVNNVETWDLRRADWDCIYIYLYLYMYMYTTHYRVVCVDILFIRCTMYNVHILYYCIHVYLYCNHLSSTFFSSRNYLLRKGLLYSEL